MRVRVEDDRMTARKTRGIKERDDETRTVRNLCCAALAYVLWWLNGERGFELPMMLSDQAAPNEQPLYSKRRTGSPPTNEPTQIPCAGLGVSGPLGGLLSRERSRSRGPVHTNTDEY